jgi:hypothetical protein
MSKYKVGDKVRVRTDLKHGAVYHMEQPTKFLGYCVTESMHNLRGTVVTITADKEFAYGIAEFSEPWFTDEMFEGLVEDVKMFTKKDLRNGDVVLKRNGNTEIVVLPLGTLATKFVGYNLLDDINDDLTSKIYTKYDIVAVRRPTSPGHCRFDAFDVSCGELVYERCECKPKRVNVKAKRICCNGRCKKTNPVTSYPC